MNLFLKHIRLIDPASKRDEILDIRIVDGKISSIGKNISAPKNAEIKNCDGLVAMPGFFDMHVHLREPGQTHKETVATGCASAAAGGFTGVCCMPNTEPPIDNAGIVALIKDKAKNLPVDVYCCGTATKARRGTELAPIAELAEAGVVMISDDGSAVENSLVMRRALEYTAMFDLPVVQHCEDHALTHGAAMNEGATSTQLGLPGWPAVAEDIIIARDVLLTEYLKMPRYHVAHLSTAVAVRLVREAKARGARVTCEVTPHHFVLTDEEVKRRAYDTNTKMNPPLRSQADIDAIKKGLSDGTIDVIATDHAPHAANEKEQEFIHAPFGIVGMETAIGLAITHLVEKKMLTLSQLAEKMSVNPRRILKLPAISFKEGSDANITIIDPKKKWKVDIHAFKSKSNNSPFHGVELIGKAAGIINKGQSVWS